MTLYHQQLLKLKKDVYRHDALYQQIINAKLFIDKHFTENIRLDDMTGKAFLSKFHFLRLFKDSYGTTPHQYLTEQRIRKAKQLLRSGMPATEVCTTVGFESISSFTRLFKKMTGTPPSVFQKNSKMKSTPLSPIVIGHCVNSYKRA